MKRKRSTRTKAQAVTETYRRYTERHKERYKQLLANNQYLLSIHTNKHLIDQLKELRSNGIKLSRQCYYQILHGTWFSLNVALPYYLEEYWGIPAQTLLYEDLRTKDELTRITGELNKVDDNPFG